MEKVLVLLTTQPDGSLANSALEALGSAKTLIEQMPGSRLAIGLIGEQIQPGADTIASCGADGDTGTAGFFAVSGPDFAQPRYATDAAAAEAICRAAQASLILAPATLRMNRFLPGVAQRLGGRVDTHATGISMVNHSITVNRWYYRQRLEATLQRKERPWFVLVEPGSATPWMGTNGTAKVEMLQVTVPPESKRTEVIGIRSPAAEAQTIRPEADLLFVAGAGWTKKQADGQPHVQEAERLISNFLKLSRASLGSSKSLVDLGGEGQAVLSFLSYLNQVGQTGSTPRHPKGLATCCHGEEPHTVGWRFINERRAINLDPNCGWARGKADVLYVADAFAVISKLNELLAAKS
jgi:electron transfer flavoprotein alpha subunit